MILFMQNGNYALMQQDPSQTFEYAASARSLRMMDNNRVGYKSGNSKKIVNLRFDFLSCHSDRDQLVRFIRRLTYDRFMYLDADSNLWLVRWLSNSADITRTTRTKWGSSMRLELEQW